MTLHLSFERLRSVANGALRTPTLNIVNEKVFTVSEFFTADECGSYINLAELIGFTDAPINTSMGMQIQKDVRNNTRVMLDDQARANDLWSRIKEYIPMTVGKWAACGVNERLRFYRYDVGQQFDWHYDGAFLRDNGERSHLTFMIYLNDGFEGGETTIEGTHIVPKQGLALFFVHQQLHKGQPVYKGRKYVLRTDVMYRRADASLS